MAAIPPLSSGAGQPLGPGRQDVSAQARVAAQRAFFQAALGQVQAANAAPSRPQSQANQPMRTAPAEDAPTERIPRPGSIINIVV
ncbi:MAG TPA: hypothetical protein VHY32_11795 [Caulobacteraceae bacterium]|nr:hypothetical protein [Caulobacteraceae bacterium]